MIRKLVNVLTATVVGATLALATPQAAQAHPYCQTVVSQHGTTVDVSVRYAPTQSRVYKYSLAWQGGSINTPLIFGPRVSFGLHYYHTVTAYLGVISCGTWHKPGVE